MDPWNNEAVDNLGLLYELSVNVTPETPDGRQVSPDDAAQRLERVWKQDAPVAPLALEIGAAVGVSAAAGELGTRLRLDFGYGRDGTGGGLRVGVVLPWTRQLSFPDSGTDPGQRWVNWTRFSLDVGPRYRLRVGSLYGEIEGAVVLASVLASGHGFDTDYTSTGWNFGGTVGLRLGKRLGRFNLWVAGAGTYYAGKDSLELVADNIEETARLPSLDVSVLAGLSALFWQ